MLKIDNSKIFEEDALLVIREVTDTKIKEAMFDIGDNKDQRPDGYSSMFFKIKLALL